MSTRYISVEEATKALQDRKPYATIKNFHPILRGNMKREYGDNELAIDILDLPPEKLHVTTTLPHFIIVYLHNHKGEAVEETDLKEAAYKAGYNNFPTRRVREYFYETQAHIPCWYESKEKKTYYQWTEPSELSNKTQAALDRGDDW